MVERESRPQMSRVTLAELSAVAGLSRFELIRRFRDEDNRAAVRAVPTDELDLVGIGLRAPHRDADAILRGLSRRHP